MSDITNPRLLYVKAGLFIVLGLTASAMLLWLHPEWTAAFLLAVAVWAFARAYYFAFYVVEHYIDREFRFAGLFDFVKYAIRRRASGE